MSMNHELDLGLIRSRSCDAMASYDHWLFDCFQADGSVDVISDSDPEFLPKDRFSDGDSSDDVDIRNVSTSSRHSTSKSRPKDNLRRQYPV